MAIRWHACSVCSTPNGLLDMPVIVTVRLACLACLALLLQAVPPAADIAPTLRRVATMRTARAAHTATGLPSGQVLVAGGMGDGGASVTSVELFDPATQRFRPAGSLVEGRSGQTATLLPDGRVLFVGGVGRGWTFLRSAEVYDPRTGRSELVGSLRVPRGSHTATMLEDGRVLIIGGADRTDRVHFATTEIWVVRTGTFGNGPSMASRRYKIAGTSILLPDGDVLVTSGAQVAERLDVRRLTFRDVPGPFPAAFRFAAAAPLRAGDVFIAGGYSDGNRNTAGI